MRVSGSVVSLEEACELREKAASQGRRVVFAISRKPGSTGIS
jgi:hypothetical protein